MEPGATRVTISSGLVASSPSAAPNVTLARWQLPTMRTEGASGAAAASLRAGDHGPPPDRLLAGDDDGRVREQACAQTHGRSMPCGRGKRAPNASSEGEDVDVKRTILVKDELDDEDVG